jgi:hypothetical protein
MRQDKKVEDMGRNNDNYCPLDGQINPFPMVSKVINE